MRLIDLDKHFELNEPFYKADIEMPLHRVKVALESLPTVKAIPIEWLLDKQKEIFSKSEYHRRDWQLIEDIDKLIEEWEKENETN